MANLDTLINPLYSVRIGSTINSNSAKFAPSVLNGKISVMVTDKHVVKSMSGESAYVYSDRMNQGSFGVSGSYGASGVSKYSAAITAYAGNAAAQSSKSVKVNFNINMISGVEYIKFDDLSPQELLNAMQAGPKELLLEALDAFIELKKAVTSADQILKAVDDPKNNQMLNALIDKWVKAINTFFLNYGDGVVVGVIWGGMGTVSLEMNNAANESNWKYGASGNFSYSGVGSSISVQAAYDGSKSNRESDVKVNVLSWASGGCVQKQVDDWSSLVTNKAFSEICDIKLLEKAPGLDKVSSPPAIPEFQKPSAQPSVADKFKELKDLQGLEAFAIASAYDTEVKRRKEANEDPISLKEFMDARNQNANVQPAEEVVERVRSNAGVIIPPNVQSTLRLMADEPLTGLESEPTDALDLLDSLDSKEASKGLGEATPTDDYTVLGAWIANWADLFPWLTTGYLNSISNNEEATAMLKTQGMIQDMLTLSRMYYMFSASSLNSSDFGIDDFEQVADSFKSVLAYLRLNIDDKQLIPKALKKLNASALGIYKQWDKISFLRNAELGLGISLQGKTSVRDKVLRVESATGSPTVFLECGACKRSENDSNVVFKSFVKGAPLITPQGEIYFFGPANMLLKSIDDKEAAFTRRTSTAVKFEVDSTKQILKKDGLVLYPIRFEDARELDDWKGQIVSTNLGANEGLIAQLQSVIEKLKRTKALTLSSANWANNPNWTSNQAYHLKAIPTQYYGIIDSVGNVFTEQ